MLIVQFLQFGLKSIHTFGIGELEPPLLGRRKPGGSVPQGRLVGYIYPQGMMVPRMVQCVKVTTACYLQAGGTKDSIHLTSIVSLATGWGEGGVIMHVKD